MTALRLYVLQRGTAMLMVPMIAVHLAVIFYATSNGLSAADILGRTRGSVVWALFYQTFVIAAAIHGAIGVRSVAKDWLKASPAMQSALMWGFGAVLLLLGTRAVVAVIVPGGA